MAHFSNGTEGDMYEAQYCAKCAHWARHDPESDSWSCPVMDVHACYNYDQCKRRGPESLRLTARAAAIAGILGYLIPRGTTDLATRDANGKLTGETIKNFPVNLECRMFHPIYHAPPDVPGQEVMEF